MTEVAVSILNVEKDGAVSKFYNLETAHVDYFHIDVMDGRFVEANNLLLMKDYATTLSHITLVEQDIHLMVQDVEEILDEYMDLGPNRITFHIEAMKDSHERTMEIIRDIKENGNKVGLAVNPATPIEDVYEYLPYIHAVTVMTVVPGKGGQSLIPETLDKIKQLREYCEENGFDIDIEADGGVTGDNAEQVRNAGANILVSGTYIVKSDNMMEAVENIRG